MSGPNSRRGIALVWVAVVLLLLVLMMGWAVDTLHASRAAQQLQTAADAAALAGARCIPIDISTAPSAALTIAAANHVAGSPVQLASTDVVLGQFDRTRGLFTPTSTAPNAVRVTARRTADSPGGSLALLFGSIVGVGSIDLQRSAVAMAPDVLPSGFVAYNGITLKNNFYFGNYDSHHTTNPSPATTEGASYGSLQTNTTITGKNNNEVHGDIVLGHGGHVRGVTLTGGGTTTTLSGQIPLPPMPDWSPHSNPQGISRNYDSKESGCGGDSGNDELPGGTYWFTSLTVENNLTFTGPATIYLNGNLTLDGALTAYKNIPANLRIYILGPNRTFGPSTSSGSNHMTIIADVWAPTTNYNSKNNDVFMGRAFFNSITALKNNAQFYYDSSLTTHDSPYLVR